MIPDNDNINYMRPFWLIVAGLIVASFAGSFFV